MKLANKLLILLGLFGSSLSLASEEPTIAEVEKHISSVRQQVSGVKANYASRRGLIGKTAAEEMFNKAVVSYMLGNYDKSAASFYVLVNEELIEGYAFENEAIWYLADSAYQINQYGVATEACL